MGPVDVWNEVQRFMSLGNAAFHGGGAFERIFRSSAELTLRNELQIFLRTAKPEWFSTAEYKMKSVSPTAQRQAGDLALFDGSINGPANPFPDVIVECKHYSSLQPLIRTHGGKPVLSMPADCYREITRWQSTTAIRLDFFTSVDPLTHPLVLNSPSGYSFLDSYAKGNLLCLPKSCFPIHWQHYLDTFDNLSIAQEVSLGRPSTPIPTRCVVSPTSSPIPTRTGFDIASACCSQMFTIGRSTMSGTLYVIGVWAH